jgi:hypothetical protein
VCKIFVGEASLLYESKGTGGNKLKEILMMYFRFYEMCEEGDPLKALKFLQVELGQVVDHSQPAESLEFRSLTSTLFKPNGEKGILGSIGLPSPVSPSGTAAFFAPKGPLANDGSSNRQDQLFKQRTQLYEALLDYFPSYMKQPKNDLIDLTPF